MCVCIYRVSAKTQGEVFQQFPPHSWQESSILTKICDSSPLIPSFPFNSSLSIHMSSSLLISASGPQQDNCFNINHSHTPCQTHGSERQSKKNKRARYSRWILNNSVLSQTTTAPLSTGLCAFTPHLLILTQTSRFNLSSIHMLAIRFRSNLDLVLIQLDISGRV